jgi:hypothetical protein
MTTQYNQQAKPPVISVPAIFADTRQTVVGVSVLQILSWVGASLAGLQIIPIVLIALLVLALSLSILVAVRVWVSHINYEKQREQILRLEAATKSGALLAELDDSLLRLISELVDSRDKATTMRNLQIDFLIDVTKLFRWDVSRASLLRPHSVEPYLVRRVSVGMPGPDGGLTEQYIGPDNNTVRGSAGKAFWEKRVIISRMPNPETGEQGNLKETAYIEARDRRTYPPYKVCVSVPILAAEGEDTKCLGVYCLDSMRPDVFDGGKEDILLLLGRRIASAITIYESLRSRRTRANGEVVITATYENK